VIFGEKLFLYSSFSNIPNLFFHSPVFFFPRPKAGETRRAGESKRWEYSKVSKFKKVEPVNYLYNYTYSKGETITRSCIRKNIALERGRIKRIVILNIKRSIFTCSPTTNNKIGLVNTQSIRTIKTCTFRNVRKYSNIKRNLSSFPNRLRRLGNSKKIGINYTLPQGAR